MIHAVVALDVELYEVEKKIPFAGTAKKFSPHITLLPRFKIARSPENQLVRHFASFAKTIFPPIELVGPITISKDLIWYECTPRSSAFRDLLDLHFKALRALRADDICVFREFIRENFRPHLTVFWNGAAPVQDLPKVLIAQPRAVSLYQYPGDPKLSAVRRRQIASFDYISSRDRN
jgi:2'-5' RNA ligase